MTLGLQIVGSVLIGTFGVVTARVLIDRLFNGERYVCERREKEARNDR